MTPIMSNVNNEIWTPQFSNNFYHHF